MKRHSPSPQPQPLPPTTPTATSTLNGYATSTTPPPQPKASLAKPAAQATEHSYNYKLASATNMFYAASHHQNGPLSALASPPPASAPSKGTLDLAART